jgi:hypothetical protein
MSGHFLSNIFRNPYNKSNNLFILRLDRLLKAPECYISETLNRTDQRYLRKIYYKRVGQESEKYFSFDLDWNMDYLGR